jgi:CheY-like chemotaxis protein
VKEGVKILLVDDELMLRDTVQRLLEFCGHEVETAANGEAALALLAEHSYDIVITDFSMPGMQGDQLAARIRQQWPRQAIIMATAFVEEYRVFGDNPRLVDALLFKPFTLKDLRDTIELVLLNPPPASGGMIAPDVESLPSPHPEPPPKPPL